MRSIFTRVACAAAALASVASAASYDTIPDIEVYGQHFFYTNNGSQFYFKGVAYQQNYSPNGSTSTNTSYTDPLADANGCKRDIPYLKQIATNIIRVYAIDPTQNHDDCMAQLASANIYVLADLGEPKNSIISNNPEWDVSLYNRYTSVVDALAKYKNVVGFFAGNENVSKNNETAAAAFVKAAVRDTKQYILNKGYRKTLGVGYATADVEARDQLAAYFACQPGDQGNKTSIDFWGINIYSWCGDSSYTQSQYDLRVDFFSKYPVPVFFAEYGCNQNLPGGPTSRPFTEVPVLYGSNMTGVISGGIVFEWFYSAADEFGLVSLTNNDASISVYPDFTSLSKQIATVSPTVTQKSNYKPSNTPPACPSVGGSWVAQASPLPPTVNPDLCSCMAASLSCNVKSTNEQDYADIFNYVCGKSSKFCTGISKNATTGAFGGYSGCDPKDQLGFVLNQYYMGNGKSAGACDFSGKATVQSATTASTCVSLLNAVGSNGSGTVPTATGRGGAAGGSSSKGAASHTYASQTFLHGSLVMTVWVGVATGSLLGMLLL